MKKNILPVIAVAIMVFLGACSNSYLEKVEEDIATKPEIGRTVTITASVPGHDNPATRVALDEDGAGGVDLTWQTNDPLKLAIKQNGTEWLIDANISNITNFGKRAEITFSPPSGLDQENPFDFYGVYGGNGIEFVNGNATAILPTNTGTAGSLNELGNSVQSRKDVMLYFKSEGFKLNTATTVKFEHLGFLFFIKLKNRGPNRLFANDNVKNVRLKGIGGTKWAYSGNGGQIDLTNNNFSYTTGNIADNNLEYIPFFFRKDKLKPNDTHTFVGWSTLAGTDWPALKFEMSIWKYVFPLWYQAVAYETPTSKPKSNPTIGRAYTVYIEAQSPNNAVNLKFLTKDEYNALQ